MAWRTLAAVLITVFVALAFLSISAGPLDQFGEAMQDEDPNDGDVLNPTSAIDGITDSYFNMFMVLVFGIGVWGLWRVARRELTQDRL